MATVLVLAVTLAWWRVTMSCGGCQRLKLDLEAELAELADEAPGPDLDGALFEVVGTKILVGGTILQHVVDRGEQRCGDRAGGDLLASFAAYPMEQRPVVAVFLSFSGPGALDEHGLEPRRTFP